MVPSFLQGSVNLALRLVPKPLRRLTSAGQRWLRRVWRWALVWLAHLLRSARFRLAAAWQVSGLMMRPANPNNLFTTAAQGDPAADPGTAGNAGSKAERSLPDLALTTGRRRHTLLYAAGRAGQPPAAISLRRGLAQPDPRAVLQQATAVNHRFSYAELLSTEIKRLRTPETAELSAVVNRLARRWLDLDQSFEPVLHRTRLDVRRTLRENIPRYAGHVLHFAFRSKYLPVPQLAKPARLLVIGDVSQSMAHYASIVLFFFHLLNFHFHVDSYVFSNHATRSTVYLNGPGSFPEKVRDLVTHAASWNAGTRFGRSLEQIVQDAPVDEHTYVIIATDGKVMLSGGEYERVHTHLAYLHARARMVVFLTPDGRFAAQHNRQVERLQPVGQFSAGGLDIPIFDLDRIWLNMLGQYADRIYWVQTVQDLLDMCEDLYRASRQHLA